MFDPFGVSGVLSRQPRLFQALPPAFRLGGDANHNDNVRYNGPSDDRDALLTYLGGNEVGFLSNVYTTEDMNLDGIARYNGPANDRDALLSYPDGNETGFVSAQTTAGTLSSSVPECAENPTPVTWSYFNATVAGKDVILAWETQSERANALFDIQHSTNAYTFETVGTLNGAGTTPQKRSYRLTDKPATTNTQHYYRPKLVDADGTYSFSRGGCRAAGRLCASVCLFPDTRLTRQKLSS